MLNRENDDVEILVEAARRGEPAAWDNLVRRFRPLVWGVARGFRLDEGEVDDIAQIVWLRLFEHLARIREPRALPKWVRTTTRRECLRHASGRARVVSIELVANAAERMLDQVTVDGELLRSEAVRIIRRGLAELPAAQRDLLLLLATEPALSYQAVGRILGMPVGSIGPTRARGLARLRATAAVRAYLGPIQESSRVQACGA